VPEFELEMLKNPTLIHDREAEALYLQFSDEEITETIELADNVYVDVDKDGNPSASKYLAPSPICLRPFLLAQKCLVFARFCAGPQPDLTPGTGPDRSGGR
jgi:hypothetical protein